jgi:ankyrin repeat protein
MYRAKLNEVDTCVLEILLKFGAEVNTVSQIGGSALHLAVNDGLTKVVRLLLNHGADVDSKDNVSVDKYMRDHLISDIKLV